MTLHMTQYRRRSHLHQMYINKYAPLVLCILALALSCAPFGSAQDSRAEVTGRVTDQSESVIPGADVTLTNTATRVEGRRRPIDPASTRCCSCSLAATKSQSNIKASERCIRPESFSRSVR